MDIRASLIIDCLRVQFPILKYGRIRETPLLRPVFYSTGTALENNRIYISKPDMLPPQQNLNDSMLLICAEGMPSLAYQHCGCPLLVARDTGIMDIFNEILAIFERYEIWEKSLKQILSTNANIQEMVQITGPLLMNDITVVDKDLHIIAAASYRRGVHGQPEVISAVNLYDSMPIELADKYQQGFMENLTKKDSYFADYGCYCKNVFIENQYWGNLSVFPMLGPLKPSDPYIFDIMADAIIQALHISSVSVQKEIRTEERIIRKLMDGESVETELLEVFNQPCSDSESERYLFLCIRIPEDFRKVTHDYLAESLHKVFPKLILFEFGGILAGVNDFNNCVLEYDAFLLQLSELITKFKSQAGISNRFSHLQNIRYYYNQALWALNLGISDGHGSFLHHFHDYALRYLMLNSSGFFTAKYVSPQNLLALQKYNKTSDVDYWGTLRCYLDEERNIAKTAKRLGIHRNTTIQRIERIESLLSMDLDNPMVRLWLRVSIWLTDEEAKT